MRGQLLEPDVVVVQKSVLIVVDEHRGGDVHGIDEAKPFLDPTLIDQLGHRITDVHEPPPRWHLERKIFRKRFHRTTVLDSDSSSIQFSKRGPRATGITKSRQRMECSCQSGKTLLELLVNDLPPDYCSLITAYCPLPPAFASTPQSLLVHYSVESLRFCR